MPQKTLCETLLVSAKLLSYPCNAWSVIFLWIVISTLPNFVVAQILFVYPMNTPKLMALHSYILPWGLNSCHVSNMVILQAKRGRSNMYPLVTGWLWKRLSIQQWKQALLSSLFQCGCVELSSLWDNSGIYSNWFCITRIMSHYVV